MTTPTWNSVATIILADREPTLGAFSPVHLLEHRSHFFILFLSQALSLDLCASLALVPGYLTGQAVLLGTCNAFEVALLFICSVVEEEVTIQIWAVYCALHV